MRRVDQVDSARRSGPRESAAGRWESAVSAVQSGVARRRCSLGLWSWDVAVDELSCSPECLTIFGVSQLAGSFSGLCGRIHADSRDAAVHTFQTRLQDQDAFPWRTCVVCDDGSLRWLVHHCLVQRDKAGEPVRVTASVRMKSLRQPTLASDVNERELLVAGEAIARVGSFIWQYATETLIWSQGLCHIFGVGMVGEPVTTEVFLQCIDPDDMSRLMANSEEVMQLGGAFQTELKVTRLDGAQRIVECRAQVVLDASGQAMQLQGVCLDVTDRKAAEQELLDTRRRLDVIARGANVGLWDWDVTTNNVYYSPEWKAQLGYGDDEVGNCYEEWEQRLHPDDYEATLARVQATVEGKLSHFECEFRLRHRDGGWRWILARGFSVDRVNGKTTRMMGIHLDVTDRKHAETTVQHLVHALHPRTGQDFFEVLTKQLSTFCGVDWAVVAEVASDTNQSAVTLACVHLGEVVENVTYGLSGTPCEEVFRGVFCHYANGIQQTFPDDVLLRRMNVESYMGVPLTASDGRTFGLLAVMHSQPIECPEQVETILRVMAARASAELERQRMQRRVAENEKRWSDMIRHMPVMFAAADDDYRVVQWNEECERVTGLTSDEMVGSDRWANVLLPDEKPPQSIVAGWTKRTNTYNCWESQVTRRDGSVRNIAWSDITRDVSIPGVKVWAVGVDVTELKKSEQELRLMRYAVDRAEVAVFWTDDSGCIKYVNEKACQTMAYSRDELMGRDMADFIPDETRGDWREQFRTMREITGCNTEQEFCRANGHRVPVTLSINHIEMEGEEHVFVFAQDVSQRKAMETRLQQQSAELMHVSRLSTMGQMVAALSHELAQPLGAIANYAGACAAHLTNERIKDPLLQECIGSVRRQAQRTGEILHRVRDFVRRTDPRKSDCDLAVLVQDSLAMVANDFRRHGVSVKTTLGDGAMDILADRIQLQQMIINLLTNARDAVQDLEPDRREIELRVSECDGWVMIEIEDQGPGLTAAIREKLFEPFVTTKAQGMGIGLSICRSIVVNHHGTIAVLPARAGGTCCRVCLPVTGQRRQQSRQAH